MKRSATRSDGSARAAALLPFSADPADLHHWSSADVSDHLLGRRENHDFAIPLQWLKACGRRLWEVREVLRRAWVGLDDQANGPLTDWVLAAAIARENALLLGLPGVAKSEIAVLFFRLLGLTAPPDRMMQLIDFDLPWAERAKREREQQKYFHYLLNRFTQPEELFGPIEIDLLRKGILARVNFGLLTGPGVRGAFLDEVFKASPNILNSLLTLMMERKYFNWGGMRDSDLLITIGASNELPGETIGGSQFGVGAEEFVTLYPYLDRFAIRLNVPLAEGSVNSAEGSDRQLTVPAMESDLGQAFTLAMGREASRFSRGDLFSAEEAISSVNDVLLAGRACFQHELVCKPSGTLAVTDAAGGARAEGLFQPNLLDFRNAFMEIAAHLQQDNTRATLGEVTWTISPRKLRSLYKIALAHALVSSEKFLNDPSGDVEIVAQLGRRQLRVFSLIADSSVARTELQQQVQHLIDEHASDLPAGIDPQ
jgi:MoxR-like ATPase